jgi:hypothetical protein
LLTLGDVAPFVEFSRFAEETDMCDRYAHPDGRAQLPGRA